MLSALITLGGIIAGFMATMETLLIGMKDGTRSSLLTSGYMAVLRRYLNASLWSALLLCFVSILGFASEIGNNDLYIAFLLGLLTYSFACLYRVTRIGVSLLG